MIKNILKYSVMIIIVISLLGASLYAYARYEFNSIKTKKIDIEIDASTYTDLKDLKVIFLSDFQFDYGYEQHQFWEKNLERAISHAKSLAPDLILLGGDYTNYAAHNEHVLASLNELTQHSKVVAVLGNHDYSHLWKMLDAFEKTDITLLQNEVETIRYGESTINICGVLDYWFGASEMQKCKLHQKQPNQFNILLTHQPDYVETLSPEFFSQLDFIIAGHTHAGQITFFGLYAPAMRSASKYGQKYRYGWIEGVPIPMYVSSGLGGPVFKMPLRFFARPEIVLFNFVEK